MIIGFSLGSCHKIADQIKGIDLRDSYLSWWRLLQKQIGYFNAIEITMTPEQEKNFILSPFNKEWLFQKMKYISYHLTQCTSDTEKVIRQLPFIDKFICHVDNKNILTDDFIKKYKHKILFENVEEKEIPFLKSDSVCFDIAHALSIKDRALTYFKQYEKQIQQIHVSGYDPEKKHIPLHHKPCFSPNISLRKYPLILEANFESIEEIKKELLFVKEKFYYA